MQLHSFKFYRKLKVQRFKQFFLGSDVIRKCELWKRRLTHTNTNKHASEGAVLRFVVKWHPSLAGLNSVIANFFRTGEEFWDPKGPD